MKKKFWLTILLFTGITPVLWAQPGSNKAQLKKDREKQINSILETQQLIAKRHQQQSRRKELKNIILKNQAKEKIVLDTQRKEKDVALSELTSQKKDSKKHIVSKKKRDKELQNSFLAIVRKDKKKKAKRIAAKKERNKIATTGSLKKPGTSTTDVTTPAKKTASYLELNEKDGVLGTDFGKSCGSLPWPVDNGFVSTGFGFYIIDGTTIKGNNPGITIATTSAGVSVTAVFEGEVWGIDNKGDVGTIYIRHGKYYTVYSNLSSIKVTKGAIVKKGQVIGLVGEANEGPGGQLDFVLMIENKNVNPELWLRH
jgi:septal ring factor EnvC (AmiA/AmiB activator)